MPELDKVLETEYSENFDKLRKNRMLMSFYKYGPVRDNYKSRNVDAIRSLERRLEAYRMTGNTEYLIDVANFAMIEFMYPQHTSAHFEPTDSDKSPGLAGLSVNEIKQLQGTGAVQRETIRTLRRTLCHRD